MYSVVWRLPPQKISAVEGEIKLNYFDIKQGTFCHHIDRNVNSSIRTDLTIKETYCLNLMHFNT